ncbi:MAG TPA: ATP-binding protein [Anaeromyxobacteraceae bacterium]|nr:ATP-binding protein [Anaeromyxobacteraceae bacterium]
MSLRLQITALFAAILLVTMGVGASLGESIAARAVEEVIKERTAEVASSISSEIDFSSRELRELDRARIAERLAAVVARHRGLRVVELAIRRLGKDDVIRISFSKAGVLETVFEQREFSFSEMPKARLVGSGDTRVAEANQRVDDPFGRAIANIHIEAYVADAEQIADRERRVFLWVTASSSVVLALAFTLVLGRMLVRPLSRLASAMADFQSGASASPAIPGAERRDEIGTLARGLDTMLARVRGFSHELQEKVDAATADLARKNRALAELNDLLVEARRDLTANEQLAALGQLSGTIAHELGNPLNAISGHVQLLARSPNCPQGMKEELTVIEREVKRMTSIIRRFLDSARALTPAPEPVEIATLIDEALSLTVSAEARARIAVERDVPTEMGRATLDPSLVRHVLTNFISNAVDAMAQGGRLTVRARRAGDQIALTVQDSGPGIGTEERKRIFEPFYSTKPRGKGTGLGLSICREIAAALKGHIELETAPGEGAAFTLYVPAPAWRAANLASSRA